MKKTIVLIPFLLLLPAVFFAQKNKMVDSHATAQTKALFSNLMNLSKAHTLFGHQHATQYGHGWSGDADRSDVKSVTGSHPAVIGVDFSGFSGRPAEAIKKGKRGRQKKRGRNV